MGRSSFAVSVPNTSLFNLMSKNGSEVPLSLKRTLSQSSDPHRAYILIELGSFEDTVGRIDHQELDIQKGSPLSSMFFYKASMKFCVSSQRNAL